MRVLASTDSRPFIRCGLVFKPQGFSNKGLAEIGGSAMPTIEQAPAPSLCLPTTTIVQMQTRTFR